jgi:hypothetical protein
VVVEVLVDILEMVVMVVLFRVVSDSLVPMVLVVELEVEEVAVLPTLQVLVVV